MEPGQRSRLTHGMCPLHESTLKIGPLKRGRQDEEQGIESQPMPEDPQNPMGLNPWASKLSLCRKKTQQVDEIHPYPPVLMRKFQHATLRKKLQLASFDPQESPPSLLGSLRNPYSAGLQRTMALGGFPQQKPHEKVEGKTDQPGPRIPSCHLEKANK